MMYSQTFFNNVFICILKANLEKTVLNLLGSGNYSEKYTERTSFLVLFKNWFFQS